MYPYRNIRFIDVKIGNLDVRLGFIKPSVMFTNSVSTQRHRHMDPMKPYHCQLKILIEYN
jgi:hypothetical protein